MIPFDAGRWIATQVHTPVWYGSTPLRLHVGGIAFAHMPSSTGDSAVWLAAADLPAVFGEVVARANSAGYAVIEAAFK